MQVDGDCSELRQLDCKPVDRIRLELREDQGFELTELFEAGKTKPSLLKCFPSLMPSANRRLQHLRMHFA
jgi:hypothetical protein